MADRADDRKARRPIASRAGVRILLGVAAAAVAVWALLERREEPDPSGAAAEAASVTSPSALAPAPKAEAAPPPPGNSPEGAPQPAALVGPPPVPGAPFPTAPRRPEGDGIRGRLEFDDGLPPGLAVRVAQDPTDASRGGDSWLPVEATIAADGTFDVSLPDGSAALVDVTWQGGSARFRGSNRANDGLDLALRLGTARLSGRIVDSAGRPVVGATVRDEIRRGRWEFVGVRTAITDVAGSWVLDHLPAGKHAVQTTRPAGSDLEGDVRWDTVTLASDEHRTLELGVGPDDAIWSGRLRRRDGGPPAGPGHLFFTHGTTHLRASYDAQGAFRIAAPPGLCQVVVEPPGPRRGFVFELPPELRVEPSMPAIFSWIRLRNHVNADLILAGGTVSGRVLVEGRFESGSMQAAFLPTQAGSSVPTPNVDPIIESMGGNLQFTAIAIPPGRYVVAGYTNGGVVDLLGAYGRPIVVDVVDGGEITGLELRVAGQ